MGENAPLEVVLVSVFGSLSKKGLSSMDISMAISNEVRKRIKNMLHSPFAERFMKNGEVQVTVNDTDVYVGNRRSSCFTVDVVGSSTDATVIGNAVRDVFTEVISHKASWFKSGAGIVRFQFDTPGSQRVNWNTYADATTADVAKSADVELDGASAGGTHASVDAIPSRDPTDTWLQTIGEMG